MALFQGRPERTVGQVNVGQVLPVIDVFGPKPQGLLEAGNGLFGSPGFRLSDFSSAAFAFSRSVLLAPVVPGSSWLAQKFGTMVQLRTGHNFLNRHEFVVVGSIEERDPMCEYCDYNYVPTAARSHS